MTNPHIGQHVQPDVSVIVLANSAQQTLPRALNSVLAAGLELDRLEIVIAPSDGCDYSDLVPAMLHDVHCQPDASGGGMVCNRALDMARGNYIAFLDSSDTWEPGFLSQALPLARRSGGAFAQSSILDGEEEIRRLPTGDTLTAADMAQTQACFRPIVHHSLVGRCHDIHSHDLLLAAEILSLMGGIAPVSTAAYQFRSLSATEAGSDAVHRMSEDYVAIINMIRSGETRIEKPFQEAMAAIYEARLKRNAVLAGAGAAARGNGKLRQPSNR